jgi:protein PsiE
MNGPGIQGVKHPIPRVLGSTPWNNRKTGKTDTDQSKFIDRFDDVVLGLFAFAERGLLLLIGALAIVAVGFELNDLLVNRDINLADLLLLFIYLEVLGMAYAYYSTHSVPVTLPVLIAITGITRLILLSKDSEPNELMYEAGAVLLLAIAYGALTWASNFFKRK